MEKEKLKQKEKEVKENFQPLYEKGYEIAIDKLNHYWKTADVFGSAYAYAILRANLSEEEAIQVGEASSTGVFTKSPAEVAQKCIEDRV